MEESMATLTPGRASACALTALALACLIASLAGVPASAAPANPFPVILHQPDDTQISIYQRGDEYAAWEEDTAGYAIMLVDGWWVYANEVDGNLVPTAYQVGKCDPAQVGITLPNPQSLIDAGYGRFAPTEEGATAQSLFLPAPKTSKGGVGLLSIGEYYDTAVIGTRKNLVLLIGFSDNPIPYTAQQYWDMFNEVGYDFECSGSVRDYFLDASHGLFTLDSVVPDPINLPHTFSWYQDHSVSPPRNMYKDALDALDARGFDFSQLDGNSDGWVDMVSVLVADPIWIRAYAGGPGEYEYDGVKTCVGMRMTAYYGTAGNPTGMPTIAVPCHELAHDIGLPDEYVDNGPSVGIFCLMAYGMYGWDPVTGKACPVHPCAYCKKRLGWVDVVSVSSGTHSITDVETSHQVYEVPLNFENQYFLIEKREEIGFDRGLWQTGDPPKGLLIWHVNTLSHHDDRRWIPWTWEDVEEASGVQHLEQQTGNDVSYSADYFRADNPYSNEFAPSSTPNSNSYQDFLGLTINGPAITNISAYASQMQFTVASPSDGLPSPVSATPSSGSAEWYVPITITTVCDDPQGYTNIREVRALVDFGLVDGRGELLYNQSTNKLYILQRAISLPRFDGGVTPGTQLAFEGPNMWLDCKNTTVSGSGNSLTINWRVKFTPRIVGENNIYLWAADADGHASTWQQKGTINILQHTTPPTPVTTFQGNTTQYKVNLSWHNPSDQDFKGTKIVFRTDRYPTSASDGSVACDIAASPGSSTSFMHIGLAGQVTYYYAAFAYDWVPNYSSATTYSITVQGIPDTPSISAPASSLVCTLTPSIAWLGAGFGKYQVKVTTDTNPNNPAVGWDSGEVNSGISSCTSGTLVNNTNYYIFVKIGNGFGWSSWSSARSIGVSADFAPGPVTSFTGLPSSGQIKLTWTNPTHSYFTGTTIRYRTDSYPTSATDGSLVCEVAGASDSSKNFTHTGLTDGGTYFYSAFVHNACGTYGPTKADLSAMPYIRKVHVKPALSALAIDGSPSDWNLEDFATPIRGGENGEADYALVGFDNGTLYYAGMYTGFVLPVDAADHTAKVYSRHDDQYVYFLVRCDDNDMRYSSPASANWSNDCIEFYIDPSNNHGATTISNSTSDIQLVIDANNQKNVYMTTSGYRTQMLSGITSAVVRDGTGWWLEARISKTAFDPDVEADQIFGVDFNFRDNDNDNDAGASTVYAWSEFQNSNNFPSKTPDRWGDAQLVEFYDYTPPGPVTNFAITTHGRQHTLTWTNPTAADYAGTRILLKTTGYPTGPTDGTVIYSQAGTSFVNQAPDGGKHYYAAYAYDEVPNYSTGAFASVMESRIYVDKDASGTPRDGLTWQTALATIQEGINMASAGDVIWVAGSSTNPTQHAYIENITLKNNIAVYGGFAGGETAFSQRDPKLNKTIVDGDRNGSVVNVPYTVTVAPLIDGFTIKNGSTDYGGGVRGDGPVIVSNNIITDNEACFGAGICVMDVDAIITKNFVVGNNGAPSYNDSSGGGILCYNSAAIIANNIIADNTAGYAAGLMCVGPDPMTISGNSIVNNTAMYDGGGVYADGLPGTIANNIVAFNSSGFYCYAANSVNLYHNCVFGNQTNYCGYITAGEGDIQVDPLFVDRDNGDYHLQSDSPCRDVGDNSQLVGATDMDGDPRKWPSSGTVDIGADEVIAPRKVVSFTATAGEGEITLSWTNPTEANFSGTMIRFGTGEYPASPTSGTLVCNKTNTPGSTDSYTHTGLTNGTYYYSAFAHDGTPVYSSAATATAVSDTTHPGPVTGFTASVPSAGQVYLSWTNPTDADFAGVLIVHKTSGYPSSHTDGEVIYSGSTPHCTHANAANTTAHYYAAFAYDQVPNYSDGTNAIVDTVGVVLVDKNAAGPTHDGACWNTAYLTVTAGMNAASSGQEIWVAGSATAPAGTYNERITLKEGVGLYGGFSGIETARGRRNPAIHTTTLDGNAGGSVVTALAGITTATVIDGFTICNGTGTEVNGYGFGGGVYCQGTASPTISGNVIAENYAVDAGGGIYCQGSPIISGNTLADNTTDDAGGGIFSLGAPTVTNNTITGALSDLYIYNGTSSTAVISGNTLSDIYCAISYGGGNATITNNYLTGNGVGDGICVYGPIGVVTVGNNVVSNYDYGVSCWSCSPMVINNTIVANTEEGVYLSRNSSAVIKNNVISGNGMGVHFNSSFGGTPVLGYNDVYGNTTNYSGISAGATDISLPPLFVDQGNGNYHITSSSPCKNAGDNGSAVGSTDIDGDPRISDSVVDMGADEIPAQ